MAMTSQEFADTIKWFYEKSKSIEDGWLLANEKDDENCYLIKVSHASLYSESEQKEISCKIEHHIVFNLSYGVPTVFFNIFQPNGSILPQQELWDILKIRTHVSEDNTDFWSFVTQQEHTILRRPFYTFHPCHTQSFVQKVLHNYDPRSFLIIWLSSIAPYILLKLSNKFASILN